MSIFGNITFMNEGEQAEEYLRKKQEKIDKKKDEDEKRYGSMKNSSRYNDMRYHAGSRGKLYDEHKDKYVGDLSEDPELQKAIKHRERMEKFKGKYPDSVPKAATKKDEEIINKHVNRLEDEANYGSDMARRKFHSMGAPVSKNIQDYIAATDAARRHYRRHVRGKNESSIFESVQFLNEG